jgi:hypothetical protein
MAEWNEKLSNELKQLNTIRNPSAKQLQRINQLKTAKAQSGGRVTSGTKEQKADFAKIGNAQQVLNTQNQANIDAEQRSEQANRINQYTPFGSQTYGVDANGRATSTTTLDPSQQAILDSQNALSIQGGQMAQGNLQGAGLNKAFNPNDVQFQQQQQYFTDAAFKELTRGFDKEKEQDRVALEQRLAEKGIPMGSEAFNTANSQFGDYWMNKEAQAKNQAISQGLSMWGDVANIGAGVRNQNLGEASQLSGLGGGLQVPNFVAPGTVQTQAPDVGGTALGFGNLRLGQQQLRQQNRGGGGGGGQQAPAQSSPFNDSFLG